MTDTGERLRILAEAEKYDGVAPFSESFVRGIREDLGHRHFEERSGGELAGLAALAGDGSVELVVHPAVRRRGHGSSLIRAVLEANPGAGFWAHGNLPEARQTARRLGMEQVRELIVMGIDGEALAAGARPNVPAGYEALHYPEAVKRFGRDAVEAQWLAVNNDAFSWHPEQGGWDAERLRRGMDTDWFDPEGVWFLYRGEEMAGFHWTKMHPGKVGEVYVIGLSSSFRGHGLGAPLLSLGLEHLTGRGADEVILYVEADNGPAVHRYDSMGFTVRESHVVYKLPSMAGFHGDGIHTTIRENAAD